jgi:hypothetical protein
MIENEKGFIILPMQANCSLLWEWLSYIVHNLENYFSEQDTLSVNKDKTSEELCVICFMHIHEVTYSTNNNIYGTAGYAKIVNV